MARHAWAMHNLQPTRRHNLFKFNSTVKHSPIFPLKFEKLQAVCYVRTKKASYLVLRRRDVELLKVWFVNVLVFLPCCRRP